MVTLPKEFVATKYPGYFWNLTDLKLYSMKVTGILRPLKFEEANHWNHGVAGYKVSVNGKKRYLSESYLLKLTDIPHEIPVAQQG